MKRLATIVITLLIAGTSLAQWTYIKTLKFPASDTLNVRPFLLSVDGRNRVYVISSKATDAKAYNAIYYADSTDTAFKTFVNFDSNKDSDTLTGNIGALRGVATIGTDIVVNASQPFQKTKPNTVAAAYYYNNADTTRLDKFGFNITGSGYGTYIHGLTLTKDTMGLAGAGSRATGAGPALRFYNYSRRVTTPARGSYCPASIGDYQVEPGGLGTGGFDVIRDVAVLPEGDYSKTTTPLYTSRNSLSATQLTGGIALWTGGIVPSKPEDFAGQRVQAPVLGLDLLALDTYIPSGITVDKDGILWVARADSNSRWVKGFDMSGGIYATEVFELPGKNSVINPNTNGAPMMAPCDIALTKDARTAYVCDFSNRVVYQFKFGSVFAERTSAPFNFQLDQNYPNPFNPVTTISFTLDRSSYVRLSVTNTLGQEIAVLAEETYPAGRVVKMFDGKIFGSGVYFYSLTIDQRRLTKKMLLMK
jgi:hypothetical protein